MLTPSPSKISFILLAVAAMSLPGLAESQARIVRLSDIQGSVQIDKNIGSGFEKAFINLPITQGAQLRTGEKGRAEVEFEDGSSMRLTPNTTVEFSRLGRSESGQLASEVKLVEGMTYVNWLGKSDFSLDFSREKISIDRASHFRVETSGATAKVAVFKGDLSVQGPAGDLSVEKKKTATFDVANDDQSKIENKVREAPLDKWDNESVSYHDQYAKNNTSPYGYGVSDMNYYGAYSNVPGYGMMWQPYFTGVGWDPFADGAWGFYPGLGYMFASAYPWGWMPYRYGTWAFAPGFGWGWQPGGWSAWSAAPVYRPTTLAHVTELVPPNVGTTKTVLVGKAGTTSALISSRLTLNAGSAGLGISRGSLDNLSQLNHQVAKTGFAQVSAAPQFAATSPSRSFSGFGAPISSGLAESPSMAHSGPAGHTSSGGSSTGGAHH